MTAQALGVEPENTRQLYSTFWVGSRLYGIDVTDVQEITKNLPCTRVPRSPAYLRGLINLRGQIATAIDLRKLLALDCEAPTDQMNVFCEVKGFLLALVVDRVGDVMEIESNLFESAPETVSMKIRRLMKGVYKIQGELLSILEIQKVSEAIQETERETR